jgi:hypothetical protein
MFTVFEQPPIITWRETCMIFEEFQAAPDAAKSRVLESWLSRPEHSTINAAQSLFHQFVKLRESLLGWVIATDAEDEIIERLSKVTSATDMLMRLIESVKPFLLGNFGVSEWREFFGHLTRWSKWRRPEYYVGIREKELELLKCSVEFISPDMMNHIFMDLRKLDSYSSRDCSKELMREITHIKNNFSRELGESIIQRFSRPGGIGAYWGESAFEAEKVIAFDPHSVFHDLEYRQRLIDLATHATTDKVVHENFLTYFQMLGHGATQGGSLSYSDCQALLRDHAFTKVIWTAAVARPLNLRTVGSLRKQIESLKQILDLEKDVFTLPAWFRDMEEKYFTSEVDNKA